MDLDNRYDNYSEYVRQIIKYLTKDVELHENYILTLDLIADNLDMYYKAKEDILKNGFAIVNERNQTVKNPAVQIMNSTQQMITKLLSSFPAAPMTKVKINKLNSLIINSESELEEFLNG